MQSLDDFNIICYDRKIYVPQSIRRRVLDWYNLYLNRPDDIRIAKTILEVCYWIGLFTQAEMFAKTCNIFQHLKNRKTLYGHLPPKNMSELKPYYLVHVDLIGPYIN